MRLVRLWISASCVAVALAFGATQLAAQTKPADATAQCKDGTYSTATSKQDACSDHGGIQTWYADDKSGVKSATKAAAAATKDGATRAGKATAGAAKAVGKETKDGATAAGKATAGATETAAKETKDATKTASKATAGAAETAAKATKDATKTAGKATANAIKPKPSDAPKDATGKCKDGSYSNAAQQSDACSDHGGVAEWYK